MKKLHKILIKPERLLKNEELVSLRGGTSYVKCLLNYEPCGDWYGGPIGDCSMAEEACNRMCGTTGWDSIICVGD